MSAVLHPGPIPFVTLTNWVKAAARCGFNIEPVFREAGIATDPARLEDTTVSPAALQQVMAACIERARGHHFPFVLGETFAFDYLPDLETFLTTSPTLRDSLRVFDWIRELINPMIDLRLVEEGDEALLYLQPLAGVEAAAMPAHLSESTFAAVVKFARTLLGEQAPFARIGFFHARPPYDDEYTRFFGSPVAFGCMRSELVFARDLLDLPLKGAFPALHRQAGTRVEKRLTGRLCRGGVVAQVLRVLDDDSRLLTRGLEAVAEALGLHPRTLQRRLTGEGESWGLVRDQARFRLAAKWLEAGDTTLESISERLGYSDRRSFSRAFQRWSGLSPSAYRVQPQPPLS